MPTAGNTPVVNPMIIFRQEYDDWALLFDPDSKRSYGLNPASAFVWKMLDGNKDKSAILEALRKECEGGIPDDAAKHYDSFINEMEKNGLIGYEK